MKRFAFLALAIILLNVVSAFGQSRAEIDAKFGQPLNIYSVSEWIWMTPEYASNGQVCRMRFYPKRIDGNTNYGAHDLPFNELRDVLNALVQVETRGAKKESFGVTATGGGSAWTTYDYENVTFTFVSFFPSRTYDGTILKKGEYVFPLPEGEPRSVDSTASNNDFVESLSPQTEIVTVSWKDRKCVGQ